MTAGFDPPAASGISEAATRRGRRRNRPKFIIDRPTGPGQSMAGPGAPHDGCGEARSRLHCGTRAARFVPPAKEVRTN
jgi:hypothetical protein